MVLDGGGQFIPAGKFGLHKLSLLLSLQAAHDHVTDDLRAFGINTEQWTTAAQDEGEWRRTAEQGAEHFMAKWIAAEKNKAGLRHAVVCPNVTRRTKEMIAQSKRARAGSLAIVD